MNLSNTNVTGGVPSPVVSGNGFKSPIMLENDTAVAPSDGNNRKFPREASKYRDDYWELGWTDGRLGQPLNGGKAAVELRTQVDQNAKIANLHADIGARKAKIESITTRIGTLPELLTNLREEHLKLKLERITDPAKSSSVLGLIYTLVALSLFIADLPLSLKLVAKAFEIPLMVKGAAGAPDVHVNQLFRHPFSVIFGGTWEAMFLAIGIAFSGVFVKFFLDEFYFTDTPASSSDNSAPQRKLPKLMICILALFVVTTIFLGVFRAYLRAVELKLSLFSPAFLIEAFTFTFLTLMFPVVGGVCFSAGWRRLEKAKRYYVMKLRSIPQLENQINPLQEELAREQAELIRLEELLKQAELGTNIEAVKQLNLNLYKHGYLRGCTLPETLHPDERLYPQAKQVIEKFLAQKLRARVWDGVTLNGGS